MKKIILSLFLLLYASFAYAGLWGNSGGGTVYLADCSSIKTGFCVDTSDGSIWYWNGSAVVASGGSGDYTLPTASGSTLGGVKVGTGLDISAGVLSLNAAANPSFNSIHASGGNLAAANKQVTKGWQTGLDYVVNETSVIHGGQHYICTSSHTAGSTTEPGVGVSWATVWTIASGGASSIDDLTDVDTTGKATGKILKFNSSGNLVVGDDNEGAGSLPTCSIAEQVPRWNGSAWNCLSIGTGNNNLIALNSSGQLPFTIDLANITDTTAILAGKQSTLSLPSQAEAEAGTATTARSWSAERVAQAIAALGGTGSLSIPEQATDPTLGSLGVGDLVVSKASGDLFLRTATGGYVVPGTYTPNPTLTSATIASSGTSLTLASTGSENLARAAEVLDVDCSTGGAGIPATYASGAGSASLVYTLGTTVYQGETCDLDYTSGITSSASGLPLSAITSGAIANSSAVSAYLMDEGFAAGTAPSGWTAAGTYILYNYATAPAPMEGSYSLALNTVGNSSSITVNTASFSASGDVYVAFQYAYSTAQAGDQTKILAFMNASNAELTAFQHDTGGHIDGTSAGGTTLNDFYTLSTDTPIYLKMRYRKGSPAVTDYWSSTDGSTWTSEGSISNGTSTTDATYIRFQASSSSNNQQIYDRIRVSTSDINY